MSQFEKCPNCACQTLEVGKSERYCSCIEHYCRYRCFIDSRGATVKWFRIYDYENPDGYFYYDVDVADGRTYGHSLYPNRSDFALDCEVKPGTTAERLRLLLTFS